MTNDAQPSPDTNIQDLALAFAVHCVRNTVIENYHASGKLSDTEMKAFNIEVSNKLFTALSFLLDPRLKADQEEFNNLLTLFFPSDWNRPVFDSEMWKILKHPFKPDEDKKTTISPKNKETK